MPSQTAGTRKAAALERRRTARFANQPARETTGIDRLAAPARKRPQRWTLRPFETLVLGKRRLVLVAAVGRSRIPMTGSRAELGASPARAGAGSGSGSGAGHRGRRLGSAGLAAAFLFFAGLFLAAFFGAAAAFLAAFLADFFARLLCGLLRRFLRGFLAAFFADFFFAVTAFLAFLAFLPFLLFFALAIVILLLPLSMSVERLRLVRELDRATFFEASSCSIPWSEHDLRANASRCPSPMSIKRCKSSGSRPRADRSIQSWPDPGFGPPVAQSRSSIVCTTGTDVPPAI